VLVHNDWRLDGQEQQLRKLLQGAAISWTVWSPRHGGRGHDHCEFCWAKIWDRARGSEEYDRGYVTLDSHHWICERCFADFKDRFGFHVASS